MLWVIFFLFHSFTIAQLQTQDLLKPFCVGIWTSQINRENVIKSLRNSDWQQVKEKRNQQIRHQQMNSPKHKMKPRLQRERSFSKAHYSPHSKPSADLAASEPSILFLPFNPLPWQVRESHAVRHTRHQLIWSVTAIKQCRMVVLQELLN